MNKLFNYEYKEFDEFKYSEDTKPDFDYEKLRKEQIVNAFSEEMLWYSKTKHIFSAFVVIVLLLIDMLLTLFVGYTLFKFFGGIADTKITFTFLMVLSLLIAVVFISLFLYKLLRNNPLAESRDYFVEYDNKI